MATSKNRRKNGKVVGSSVVKRLQTQARPLLKDLAVATVVDSVELTGEERRLAPRTVIFNLRTKQIQTINSQQARALKNLRWRWNIHSGVICRKPDGEVYFDKEQNIFTETEVILEELNDYLTEELLGAFQRANGLNALTLFWVAAPFDMGNVPLEVVLAPVWKFNVLGNMLTRYERENEALTVVHYRADKLSEFVRWFVTQREHREGLKQLRTFSLWFEATGEPMQKGELAAYREELKRFGKIDELGDGEPFNPWATVKGFVAYGKQTFTDTGIAFSRFISAVEQVPACLNAWVEVTYPDGRQTTIKFYKDGQDEK